MSARPMKRIDKKSLRVALVMPPSPYLANDLAYPPMGLLYIAAVIRQWRPQHTVEVIELGGRIDWRARAQEIRADVVGIQCVTPNQYIVNEIVGLLPSESISVVGGIHPTYLPDIVENEIACDVIVCGEAEKAMIRVLDDIVRGECQRRYNAEPIENLDDLPMPALDLVDIDKYRPGGDRALTVYTSRGCIFACKFCSMMNAKTIRYYSPERVVAECRRANEQYGITHFVFGDDNIGIDMNRLRVLLEALTPLKCTFRLNMSVGYIADDVARAAKAAGCTDISFGVETFSQKMLRAMKKPATAERNIRAIKKTQEYDMRAKAYLMVNYHGETEETVNESLDGLSVARPDRWLLSAFVPLPGSEAFHQPKNLGIRWLSSNWEDYYLVGSNGSFRPAFETDVLTVERQIELHDQLYYGCQQILGG